MGRTAKHAANRGPRCLVYCDLWLDLDFGIIGKLIAINICGLPVLVGTWNVHVGTSTLLDLDPVGREVGTNGALERVNGSSFWNRIMEPMTHHRYGAILTYLLLHK